MFFVTYSFVVNPLTTWLFARYPRPVQGGVSLDPNLLRRAKWRNTLLGISLLILVCACQIKYENSTQYPSPYATLGVPRTATFPEIKRAYRHLSKDVHPDKNKSPHAEDDFTFLTRAYDLLLDSDVRATYNRFGFDGVRKYSNIMKKHEQNFGAAVLPGKSMDRYLSEFAIIRICTYFGSTLLYTFLITRTASQLCKDAVFTWACFGLLCLLYVEVHLVLNDAGSSLPAWLLPNYTAADISDVLRKVFSPFLHGLRSYFEARTAPGEGDSYEAEKTRRTQALVFAYMNIKHTKTNLDKLCHVVRGLGENQESAGDSNGTGHLGDDGADESASNGKGAGTDTKTRGMGDSAREGDAYWVDHIKSRGIVSAKMASLNLEHTTSIPSALGVEYQSNAVFNGTSRIQQQQDNFLLGMLARIPLKLRISSRYEWMLHLLVYAFACGVLHIIGW